MGKRRVKQFFYDLRNLGSRKDAIQRAITIGVCPAKIVFHKLLADNTARLL